MKDFRSLIIWKESHKLTLEIYRLTSTFPKDERLVLSNQMRRSAASIPTNIAEGCGRGSNREFARFLQIALGSASELAYQLILSKDLSYLPADQFQQLSSDVDRIQRQIASLLKKVRIAIQSE